MRRRGEHAAWSIENLREALREEGSDWAIRTGSGRTRTDRNADKSALIVLDLLGELAADVAWQAAVERVRAGASPLDVATAYGSGSKRRRVIAQLLVHAAKGRGQAFAYSVPDGAGDETGGNRCSLSFWAKAARGVDCIVRRGAGRCLACDEPLDVTKCESAGVAARTRRVLYCSSCAVAADEVGDRDAAALVFDHAARAFRLNLSAVERTSAPARTCAAPVSPVPQQVWPPEHPPGGGPWTREAREAWLAGQRAA